jgi:menaquinone-dependent protoporphyrinogen IX oxidase
MRIAVVSAPAVRREPGDYVLSVVKGMASMGHHVDIVDVWTDDGFRLPGYDYIVVAAEPLSFFSGKIAPVVPKVLAAGSSLSGKKSAAFIRKTGLFANRALANLMKAMEKEGMVINWSDFILNSTHAEALGKQIGA